MKTIVKTTLLFFLIVPFVMSAQINKPSLSPRITKSLNVGLAAVTLDYGQPNKQNRPIFGDLIPYGKVWRTGANFSTKITIDREVTIAKQNVPAGNYALYTIPNANEWTVILSKNTKLWGSSGYNETDDLIRVQIPVITLKDTLETLNIYFENFHDNGGDLVIAWENTKIVLPLFVDSDPIILKTIEDKIINTTEAVNAQTYFEAAQFYLHKNHDLQTAVIWFDKAIALKPAAFWYVYYRAELALKLNDYRTAKVLTEQCLAAAKASKAGDYGYIGKCTLLLKKIEAKH